jgi:hypothetical protein
MACNSDLIFWQEILKGGDCMEGVGINGRIILNCILKK